MDFPVEEFAECVRVGGGSASGASSSVGTEVDPEAPRQVSHMSAVPGDEVLAYGVVRVKFHARAPFFVSMFIFSPPPPCSVSAHICAGGCVSECGCV